MPCQPPGGITHENGHRLPSLYRGRILARSVPRSITILLIDILDSAEAYSPRVLGQDDEGSFERPSKRSKCSCRTGGRARRAKAACRVECMKRPIENNSSPGQTVYDPFVGSGTTIIADRPLLPRDRASSGLCRRRNDALAEFHRADSHARSERREFSVSLWRGAALSRRFGLAVPLAVL